MEIAKLIRERRLELGLTMKQLGQKAGASESAVSRWEAGETGHLAFCGCKGTINILIEQEKTKYFLLLNVY